MFNFRSSYMLVILVSTILCITNIYLTNAAPAIFAFGDSLFDAGNNNYFKTKWKANRKPYGIDFIKANGRFTNGKTIVDILGQYIGVNGFIPPYLDPKTKGNVILKGVNYASGGSGIRDELLMLHYNTTGMDTQVDNFATTRQTIMQLKGEAEAERLLRSNALFLFATGSNDLIYNNILTEFTKPKHMPVPFDLYASTLMRRFGSQLKELYELDARKFIVVGIPPIGCTPIMKRGGQLIGDNKINECYEHANVMARRFNLKLKELLSKLRGELEGSTIIYVDIYRISLDIFRNYKSHGFEKVDTACCRIWKFFKCNRFSHVCRDRTKYVFWDGNHPTSATYEIIAKRILDGESPEVYPMNVRELLSLQTS